MSYVFLVTVLLTAFLGVFLSIKTKNVILGIINGILWGIILMSCAIAYSAIHNGSWCVSATLGKCHSVQGQGGDK